ncbi:MAG: flagellar protein [Geopsychrobacter sp.]|nr:flagellar protein [Geopsychrobacter sp.]
MSDRLTIIPQPIRPVGQTRPKPAAGQGQSGPFEQLLQKAQQKSALKFSGHALNRMQARNIDFDGAQLERLDRAVAQIDAKGGRDSLVLLDDTALVVSVKNETVVTVVDREQLKNNVFTKIDSAVIA